MMGRRNWLIPACFLLLLSTFVHGPSWALRPEQILIVANARVPASERIARYYQRMRQVPEDNVLLLSMHAGTTMSRQQFEEELLQPLKRSLELLGWAANIKCLLLCYGVPLRVEGSSPSREEKTEAQKIKETLSELRHVQETKAVSSADKKRLKRRIKALEDRRRSLLHRRESASTDSELCLIRYYGAYPLESWQPNPLFLGNKGRQTPFAPADVLMVVRLDGPDEETVIRMIDDAIAAEASGLKGTACIDCRYRQLPPAEKMNAYQRYDQYLRLAAEVLKKAPGVEAVTMDREPKLFQPGSCRRVALYCGWYSLARYVDAFEFVRGAVAWHIASSECVDLHGDNGQWCRNLLLHGACATLGPVSEPYLQAFPPPHLFFRLLVQGLSLAETYYLSKPFLSWRLVLVGDPLYRPFGIYRLHIRRIIRSGVR